MKFTLGQRVRIAVGQFEDYEGLVIAQQPESGEVKIQFDVFGRPVPVVVPEDLLEVVE